MTAFPSWGRVFGRSHRVRPIAPARFFARLASKPPERGEEAVAHLASSPDLDGVTGRFFKGTELSESNANSRDPTVQGRLWTASEKLVGESFP